MVLLSKLQEETHSSRFSKACNEMPLLSVDQHQVGCKKILTSPHCIKLTRPMLVLYLPVALFSNQRYFISQIYNYSPWFGCPP